MSTNLLLSAPYEVGPGMQVRDEDHWRRGAEVAGTVEVVWGTEVLGEGQAGRYVQGHSVSCYYTDSRVDLLRKVLEVTPNGPFIQQTFI